MMTSRNPLLTRLEEETEGHFTYDPQTRTWCLSGPFRGGAYDPAGPYWETDDFPASSFEEAEALAVAYLQDEQSRRIEGPAASWAGFAHATTVLEKAE